MRRDGWLRRWRRRRLDPSTFVSLPDSHPKRGLMAEPIRVARIDHEGTEELEDGVRRVTFRVDVLAADDARCPSLSVEAVVTGPERERTVSGATDMLGRVRFRMSGPPGEYAITITDVAAGGLDWDPEASTVSTRVVVP